MKAIIVSCPNCGARLRVVGDALDIRCEYCETHARVQRRTQFFERALPPPAVGPQRVAVQRHGRGFRLGVLALFVLPAVIVPLMIWRSNLAAERAIERAKNFQFQITVDSPIRFSSPPARAAEPEWQGTTALILADVDGNGSKDVIGRSRRVRSSDTVTLIALDGATGKLTWESKALGSYGDTYQGKLALSGDLLLFAAADGVVRAFALADGAERWSTKLDERVKHFCDGGADVVVALGTDAVSRPLLRASGASAGPPTPSRSKSNVECEPLPGDHDHQGRRHDVQRHELGKQLGIRVERSAIAPDGTMLHAGTRTAGTNVGMLVAVAPRTTVRWSVVVPIDPLGSEERTPEHLGIGEREVCASYYGKSVARAMRVACFALTDGKRLWDEEGTSTIYSLTIQDRTVVVSAVGRVEARSLDDGTLRWAFPPR